MGVAMQNYSKFHKELKTENFQEVLCVIGFSLGFKGADHDSHDPR